MSSENFYEAFAYLQEQKDSLKICTKDGFVSIGRKELLRFSCPLVNSIFKDIPCCNSNLAVIFLPDVSTTSATMFLKIILNGISSSDMSLSINQLKEVEEVAMMFGLEMMNIEYVHKSKADKDLHFAKAKTKETPAAKLQVESRENSLILQIKTEPSFEVDNEALLTADPPKTANHDLIKEETLDLNLEAAAEAKAAAAAEAARIAAEEAAAAEAARIDDFEKNGAKKNDDSKKAEETSHKKTASQKSGLPFLNKRSKTHMFYFAKKDWLNINPYILKKKCIVEASKTDFGGKITGKISNVENAFRFLRRKKGNQNKELPPFLCHLELEKSTNDVQLRRYMEKNTSIQFSKIDDGNYYQFGTEEEPINFDQFSELCK